MNARPLTSEEIDMLDAMWTAICGPDAQANGPGTQILLRKVLDSVPALIATARIGASIQGAETRP